MFGKTAGCPLVRTSGACSQCARWPVPSWRGRTAWRRRLSDGYHGWGSCPAGRPEACGERPPLPGDPSRSRSARAWMLCLWWFCSPPCRWTSESESDRRRAFYGVDWLDAEAAPLRCEVLRRRRKTRMRMMMMTTSLTSGSCHGLRPCRRLPSYRGERPQTLSHL